jgi:uncharacterized protein (TIGR02118 family)
MSPEEFHRYWREEHGPLFQASAAARRYVVRYEQNHVTPTNGPFAEPDVDGISIMWFRSVEDIEALFADPEFLRTISPDGARFIDGTKTQRIVTFDEEVFIPRTVEADKGC